MQTYFLVSCKKCKFWLKGSNEDLKTLKEFKPCASCYGPRKFKCPKCGNIIKLQRVNSYDNDPKE